MPCYIEYLFQRVFPLMVVWQVRYFFFIRSIYSWINPIDEGDYGGKDLWKRWVLSLEWKREVVMDGESDSEVWWTDSYESEWDWRGTDWRSSKMQQNARIWTL